FLLHFTRLGVGHHEVERLRRVVLGAGDAAPEVLLHPGVDPRIVLLPGRQALRHDVRREELGERRRHRLNATTLAPELHVPVAGTRQRREDALARRRLFAIEADALGEAQPQGEAPFAHRLALLLLPLDEEAIVIVNAPYPASAKGRIFRFGEDDRVFDRN